MLAPVEQSYVGRELELFAHALNWKSYWSGLLGPFLHGDVLEVGAGLGVNTRLLRQAGQSRWVCLEPDRQLLQQFADSLARAPLPAPCELRRGAVADLEAEAQFDTILYVDVLEHIQDDSAELVRAAAHLREGGRLLVLAPAHNWLFSPFDASIGHYRRYNKRSLPSAAKSVANLRLERLLYLDSCGLLASLCNRLLLRQDMPSLKQILFWDRVLVPVTRALDPLLLRRVGKSILAVWKRASPSAT
jgi:2-polyprenyl-3-methyl-5-hydroxy-6-metoxy-1,4-benzoquinol methylase